MPEHVEFAAMEDGDLMLAIQRGSNRAFSELVRRYRSKMFATAYRILRDEHKAEDAVQTAFLRICRSVRGFRHESKVSTWIYRITMNEALMALRQVRDRHISIEEAGPEDRLAEEMSSRKNDPAAIYEQEVLRRLIIAAVDQLEPDLREVFILRDVYGLSNQELADRLGVSIGAAKSRLHRARAAVAGSIRRSMRGRPKRGGS